MQADAQMDLVYGAWVPHPGSFTFSVTRQGYDPTKPLTWDDLGEPFAVFRPAQWNATIPAGSSVSAGFLGSSSAPPTFTDVTCG